MGSLVSSLYVRVCCFVKGKASFWVKKYFFFFLTQSETISCLCAVVQNMSMKMKMDVIDKHLTRDNDIISVGMQGSLKIKKVTQSM